MGMALASRGQFDQAIVQFQKALALKPDYTEARDHLEAVVRARQR
jgi:Tfp pilus assembly protein PilF